MEDFFNEPIPKLDLPSLMKEVSDLQSEIQDIGENDNILNKAIANYNSKFGTNITLAGLGDLVTEATELTDADTKALELISKDLSYKVALIVKTKAVITNSKLINRCLNLINEEMPNMMLNDVMFTMIQQIFSWIDIMSGLMEETKVTNFESRIEQAQSQKHSSDDLQKVSKETITQLLSAIRGT